MATAKKNLPLEHSDLPVCYMNIFLQTPKGKNLKLGMLTLDPNDEWKQLNEQEQTVKNIRSVIQKCVDGNLFGSFRGTGNIKYVVNRAGGNDAAPVSSDEVDI